MIAATHKAKRCRRPLPKNSIEPLEHPAEGNGAPPGRTDYSNEPRPKGYPHEPMPPAPRDHNHDDDTQHGGLP